MRPTGWTLRKRLVPWLAAAFAFAAMHVGGIARAEPTAADRETARTQMNEGDRLFGARDYADALRSYLAAHAIMGVPTTGIEVAKAQEALGLLVEARDTLLQVSRYPQKADEPKAYSRARERAVEHAPVLAARIPSIAIVVSGIEESTPIQGSIDGDVIPAAAVGIPRKVNPGKHTVRVSAPGYVDATTEVTVREAENAQARLSLEKGPSKAATPFVPATPGETVLPVAPAPPEPPPPAPSNTLAYFGFGLGAVGIVAGSITGLLAFSKTSDIKSNCTGNQCDPRYESDINSSKMMGTISTISFAVGVVGAGVGVVALLTGPSKKESKDARGIRVAPAFGVSSIGLTGAF